MNDLLPGPSAQGSPRHRSRFAGTGTPSPTHLAPAILALAVLGVSTGCFPGPTGWLDDYLSRVERVTGIANPSQELRPDPLLYPDRRARVADLAALSENRMGLVRSLTLRRCGLQDLVGERNSTLGKVMPPSRRLAYEVEFIRRVQACLPTLEGDPELLRLAEELQTARDAKKAALPALIWNATLGSEEVAAGFGAGEARWKRSRPRLEEAREEVKTWLDAFDELMQVPTLVTRALSSSGLPPAEGDQETEADVRERVAAAVEGPAQILASGAAGRLLATLSTAQTAMQASTRMLDSVRCRAGAASSSASTRPSSPVAAALEAAQVAEASWRKPKPGQAPSPKEADRNVESGEPATASDTAPQSTTADPAPTGEEPLAEEAPTEGHGLEGRPQHHGPSRSETDLAVGPNAPDAAEPANPSESEDETPRISREQAEILARVFEIFYVGEEGDRLERVGLQEFVSQLEQEARPLVRSMRAAIERLEAGMPEAFAGSTFRQQLLGETVAEGGTGASTSIDDRFRRTSAAHAAAWQRIFDGCGVQPAAVIP